MNPSANWLQVGPVRRLKRWRAKRRTRLVIFMLPLPEPLPFPDGSTVTFQLPDVMPELADVVPLPIENAEAPPFEPGHAFVSLRFWRASPAVIPLQTEFGPVNEAIRKGLPPQFHPEGSADVDREAIEAFERETGAYVTVVEAVTAVVLRTEDDLSEAFDRCLAKVSEVVRAYRMFSQSPRHHHVSHERMPIGVLYTTRTLADEPKWADGLSFMLLHLNVPGTAPEELSAEELDQLSGHLSLFLRDHPLSLFAERSADSRVALETDGDYGDAVVQTQISLEILLDAVLTLLLWEDGVEPSIAAEIFAQGLGKRVRTNYASRLGGDWSTDGSGVFAAWALDVARLRGRVVHRGYRPTREEARQAQETATRVETFVRERIGERRLRFPRTALLVLGRPGLQRLGLWGGQIEEFAARADEESDWVASYRAWREALDEARV